MTGEAVRGRRILVAVALLVVAACAREASGATAVPSTVTTTTLAPTTTVPPTTTTTAAPPADGHPARVVREQPWTPFATVGPVTLHHPADRVEAIGFHQSGQDGAQALTAVDTAVRWFTMASRGRDTARQGAADIVVEPGREIRSPVTGTVAAVRHLCLVLRHRRPVRRDRAG